MEESLLKAIKLQLVKTTIRIGISFALMGSLCVALYGKGTEIEGELQVGIKYANRYSSGEMFYEAHVGFDTKRREGVKGVLDFEAESDSVEVMMRNAYLNYKFSDDTRLDVGYSKKYFGLEYKESSKKRATTKRSYIYDKLENFGYAGREKNIRLAINKKNDKPLKHSYILGLPDSEDYSLLMMVENSEEGRLINPCAFLLLQSDRIYEDRQFVWASVLSLYSRLVEFNYQIELIGGVDPLKTEFEKINESNKTKYFVASKMLLSKEYSIAPSKELEPHVLLSYIIHDAEATGYNTTEILLGLNYKVNLFKVGLDIDIIGNTSELETTKRVYNKSRAFLVATKYF